ncbi:hypothetical protein Fot_37372 [Forsythia ovata]|uniref:Uncharacterized protein n=1 Tax=Forsythia ovata TaxID=205694 RepID=A0ABD1RYU4_9LAMI
MGCGIALLTRATLNIPSITECINKVRGLEGIPIGSPLYFYAIEYFMSDVGRHSPSKKIGSSFGNYGQEYPIFTTSLLKILKDKIWIIFVGGSGVVGLVTGIFLGSQV